MTGYKNPPKHTRFKKGRSGNPAGRPKGSENMTKQAKKILDEKITATDRQGKARRMSKFEAMLQNLMTNAMKGDLRAAKIIIELMYKMGSFNEPEEPGQRSGVIIMPETIPEDEWIKRYSKPQPDDSFKGENSDDE